ncbi:hypothetical protein BH11ACT8_BH11ACT8_10730 [soil metagenome]
MRALLGTALTAALVTAVGLVPPSASARETDAGHARRAAGVTLVGNGYGHGHGLSQWGAQYAAGKGLSHQKILAFYYPGLKKGSVGGAVKVLITADTSTDVMVKDRSGLKVRSLGNGKVYRLTKNAVWWRILPDQRGKRSAIQYRGSRGGWKVFRTVAGEAQFDAGGSPITLHTPAGNVAYRGVLRSAAPSASSGKRDTVNILPLESYLKGVVPREVPAQWHPAAVRAQAVAARTYAAFERREPLARHYQICDTSSCQVYGGYSSEQPESNRAVAATKKYVLLAGGKPAFAQFSASNGGYTSAGAVSYLPAKRDPYDKAYRNWHATVSAQTIEAALPAIGAFRSVDVTERDGKGAFGGRVVQIKVVGSSGTATLTGDEFRSYFGLMSTMFDEA